MRRYRPRLRFSLRTMLALVTLAGIGLGWLGYQLNWIRERRAAIATHRVIPIYLDAVPAPGLLSYFGEVGYSGIHAKGSYSPSGKPLLADELEIAHAKRLFPEAKKIYTFWLHGDMPSTSAIPGSAAIYPAQP